MNSVNQHANCVNKLYPKMLERYINKLFDDGYCKDSDLIDLLTVKWMVKLHKNYSDILDITNVLSQESFSYSSTRCSLAKYEDLLD